MRSIVRISLALAIPLALVVPLGGQSSAARPATGAGTIKGHVRLMGSTPANPPVRMGVDPVCAAMNRADPVVQEFVLKSADGGLANSLVRLDGTFPRTPVPTQPVTIAQQRCMYMPRIVAARVGQTLVVVNRDMTLHNTHSVSTKGNTFDVTQPRVGMAFSYVLKAAEIIRLKCEPHPWMTGYVAAVDHPYFALSGDDGSFTIERVPAGRHTIRVWHEVFGETTRTIVVRAGETTTVDVSYTSGTRARPAAVRELLVPESLLAQAPVPD
jgi:plastocyanin